MFHPKMISSVKGFHVPSEGFQTLQFEDMAIDFWTVENSAGAKGEYLSLHPRFVVFMNEEKVSLGMDQENLVHCSACYVPSGLKLWSSIERPQSFQHLDLHIHQTKLEQMVDGAFDLRKPILMNRCLDLTALCSLLAAECCKRTKHPTYAKSLATTIIFEMFHLAHHNVDPVNIDPSLLPVVDFVVHNLDETIDVDLMGRLAGLSRSQFCRRFKTAMGTTPHRWLLELRLEEAKRLLLKGDTFSNIANDTGFADQAHFTRSFRLQNGTTPSVWLRRYRCSKPD